MITVLASLFGVTLTTLLDHQQLVDWGWRVPLSSGCWSGPLGSISAPRWSKRRSFLKPRSRKQSRSRICCAAIRWRSC